ncbi:MAG TPA: bifunctional phosphopantothenoylcysteine decarboxylase/phosphopantothenate--cysteine ligase CoaBC [Pseudogracilibacillus sp.]|nr:bifunctional phosphopantothenoylcysteine decarboxylase/phosphopantothenate--cysteine ligase CoaBC [Pseudogracilibacillus sp.]
MWKGKNVLVGVTGGIAVYKACDLTSKLTQLGANVRVIMTEGATEFVSPLTFQALSRNDVYVDTFIEKDVKKIAHVDIADWAEIAIVAPATANTIGKLAQGIADNMLTTILIATRADVYIAPAMNVHMYANPAVMENMQKLDDWGYHFIEPGSGYLACGYVGKGRLEEPQTIIDTIYHHQQRTSLFEGKNVLITAGPTEEALDPVRYFTNHSTGTMGFALAEAAARNGATVTLVTGPVQLDTPIGAIHRVDVTTAEEMYNAVWDYYETSDIVIKAAAVADYRPKEIYDEKMKKGNGGLTIEMERTKDILHSLGERKEKQFLVGFAAETTNPLEYGKGKLKEKNLDAIVINNVSEEGAGFGTDTNIVTYVNKTHELTTLEKAPKYMIAEQLIKLIHRDYKG